MPHSSDHFNQNIEKSQYSKSPKNDLVGCDACDTISKKEPLAVGVHSYCACCGAELYQPTQSLTKLLAIVLTALIVFILANCYPIVIVEMSGHSSQTTLLGAVMAMFNIGRPLVATLVLITTFIVPFIIISLLIYVLTSVTLLKKRPKFMIPSLRLLSIFHIWAMVEVFLVGILVTLVKLVGMVIVIPGIALWSFAILSVLMVMIGAVKLQTIWDEIDRCLP